MLKGTPLYSGSRSRGQMMIASIMVATEHRRNRRIRRLFMKLFYVSRVKVNGSNHRVGKFGARRLGSGARQSIWSAAANEVRRRFGLCGRRFALPAHSIGSDRAGENPSSVGQGKRLSA